MTKKVCALVLVLGMVVPLAAVAEDALARFEGGIGVIPVSSAPGPGLTATSVTRNISSSREI